MGTRWLQKTTCYKRCLQSLLLLFTNNLSTVGYNCQTSVVTVTNYLSRWGPVGYKRLLVTNGVFKSLLLLFTNNLSTVGYKRLLVTNGASKRLLLLSQTIYRPLVTKDYLLQTVPPNVCCYFYKLFIDRWCYKRVKRLF